MRKTRNFFKNIGDIKGTFSTRMGMIKDRNSKDLQKQKRLRRHGKNIQKNHTRKVLMTQKPRWCGHSPRARHPGV